MSTNVHISFYILFHFRPEWYHVFCFIPIIEWRVSKWSSLRYYSLNSELSGKKWNIVKIVINLHKCVHFFLSILFQLTRIFSPLILNFFIILKISIFPPAANTYFYRSDHAKIYNSMAQFKRETTQKIGFLS